MCIAWNSVIQGLNKLLLNETKIKEDLEDNWMVVAEAIQTVLRREKFPQPYEALKSLTRVHGKVTKEVIHSFIDSLDVPTAVKSELKQITPWNYVGIPFLP
jgi:adenylosuccinate lyase